MKPVLRGQIKQTNKKTNKQIKGFDFLCLTTRSAYTEIFKYKAKAIWDSFFRVFLRT